MRLKAWHTLSVTIHRHGAGTPQYVRPYRNMEKHLSVAFGHDASASVAAHDGINAEVGCMHPHLGPTKVAHLVDDNAQLCCMHPSVAVGHHEPASIAHTVSNNAEVDCMHL